MTCNKFLFVAKKQKQKQKQKKKKKEKKGGWHAFEVNVTG